MNLLGQNTSVSISALTIGMQTTISTKKLESKETESYENRYSIAKCTRYIVLTIPVCTIPD